MLAVGQVSETRRATSSGGCSLTPGFGGAGLQVRDALHVDDRCEPTKPAPPVIIIRI
jgi:hypothetical protein